METSPILLFIYGTLHPDRAPREIAPVARRLKPCGMATVRGRLLDLGEYPGLLLEDAAGDRAREVPGELFEVPDAAALARLDAYEDYRPGEEAASLFLRVRTTATSADGSRLFCWVYVYNGGAPL
ncbi:MAG TPA: gamma-glutamylcyclotransferase family protein [Acidobacteriaceae bacterium]|nr:gamma-glutamylcyclotransferase family protein [Acidobacteriaceae bacterium]